MNNFMALAAMTAERGQWWPPSTIGRIWVSFGFGAQIVFTGRFVIQWLASERRGKSYVPVAFWYLSILGSLMLLAYVAFWKHDPVVSLGQGGGIVIYVRNLMLIHREKRRLQHETDLGGTGQ